jgi:hypothetical protein
MGDFKVGVSVGVYCTTPTLTPTLKSPIVVALGVRFTFKRLPPTNMESVLGTFADVG